MCGLWSRSLCGVRCRGVWVTVAVFARCVVSRSLHGVGVMVTVITWCGCRRCRHCAVCVVTVAVVAPRGRCGHVHCTMCCGCSGCHCAAWCRSCGHCYWTTKEGVSRKKRKEDVQAGRRGACSRKGHGDAMPSRSVVGPGRPSRERATTRCVPSLALWPQLISRN